MTEGAEGSLFLTEPLNFENLKLDARVARLTMYKLMMLNEEERKWVDRVIALRTVHRSKPTVNPAVAAVFEGALHSRSCLVTGTSKALMDQFFSKFVEVWQYLPFSLARQSSLVLLHKMDALHPEWIKFEDKGTDVFFSETFMLIQAVRQSGPDSPYYNPKKAEFYGLGAQINRRVLDIIAPCSTDDFKVRAEIWTAIYNMAITDEATQAMKNAFLEITEKLAVMVLHDAVVIVSNNDYEEFSPIFKKLYGFRHLVVKECATKATPSETFLDVTHNFQILATKEVKLRRGFRMSNPNNCLLEVNIMEATMVSSWPKGCGRPGLRRDSLDAHSEEEEYVVETVKEAVKEAEKEIDNEEEWIVQSLSE